MTICRVIRQDRFAVFACMRPEWASVLALVAVLAPASTVAEPTLMLTVGFAGDIGVGAASVVPSGLEWVLMSELESELASALVFAFLFGNRPLI